MSLDIEKLLASEGIDSNKLMPRHPDLQHPQTIEQGHDPLFPIYLPLKVSHTAMPCHMVVSHPNGGPHTHSSHRL